MALDCLFIFVIVIIQEFNFLTNWNHAILKSLMSFWKNLTRESPEITKFCKRSRASRYYSTTWTLAKLFALILSTSIVLRLQKKPETNENEREMIEILEKLSKERLSMLNERGKIFRILISAQGNRTTWAKNSLHRPCRIARRC